MKSTRWILLALILVVTVIDIVLWQLSGQQTISQVIWDLMRDHPVVPLLIGILAGHLCWPAPRRK